MIELFEKYADMKILAYFLSRPGRQFYKKEIARALNVSPSTVIKAVDSFHEEGLLLKEIRGREHFYSLNTENCVVPPLKKAYGLAFVLSAKPVALFQEADPGIISLVLYGSYARGDFDDLSDIDFLAITHSDKLKLIPPLKAIEDRLDKEANITTLRLSDCKSMLDRGDAFYKSVLKDHVLLFGSGLIEA
ncbi:conserved hypothetical protein [Methanocella arvoryzae MRE50]|uniref:Polymerase nucleotidyl transferase domain-containing protein n=1 Tax=Methanocella arvoryzae (strain DSM 22066 / NBRC 105507 / MRE50) TaxID=351160 RepID=Q0W4K4_METAR|nr:conserved hypothetical protein [Methanocella arvoryzae MRE50]